MFLKQQQKVDLISPKYKITYRSSNIGPVACMQKYINMNDSFGNKHSVSSTKSSQTFDESLSTLKEQLHNHQLALQTAERIIEQYQLENQQLIEQINELKDFKLRLEQKYDVLQSLFIKLDKAKDYEMAKQTKRTQEKYQLEVEKITAKYQKQITSLNQKIFFLEFQIQARQHKESKHRALLSSYNRQETAIFCDCNQNQLVNQNGRKCLENLQKLCIQTPAKRPKTEGKQCRMTAKPQHQISQDIKKSQIMIGRGSVGYQKEQNPKSRNSEHREKASSFDRRPTRQSLVRVSTAEDCLYKKFQTAKTAQKPKHLFIYDTNFSDCKDYAGLC